MLFCQLSAPVAMAFAFWNDRNTATQLSQPTLMLNQCLVFNQQGYRECHFGKTEV